MLNPARIDDRAASPLHTPVASPGVTVDPALILRTLQDAPLAARPQTARDVLAGLDDGQLATLADSEGGAETLRALDSELANAPQGFGPVDAERMRIASVGASETGDAARLADEQQELLLDLGQIALDVIGIFEPTPFADLTNTGISIWRGNWLDAGLSAAGVIPYVGDLGKLGKLPRYATMVERATELARLDPGFAQQVRPVLQGIREALDAAPVDTLPAPARDALQSIKGKLDDFFAGPGRFPEFADGARHVDPVSGRTVIDAQAGTTGSWNRTLNTPLEADAIYRTDTGYLYHTDAQGRVSRVEGELQLGDGSRNGYQQRVSGREDRLPTDQGGHLIATIFRGPGEAANLVPMDANLNLSAWKQMENGWAEALRNGDSVSVRVEPIYGGDSLRPESFAVRYQVGDGRPVTRFFDNQPGG